MSTFKTRLGSGSCYVRVQDGFQDGCNWVLARLVGPCVRADKGAGGFCGAKSSVKLNTCSRKLSRVITKKRSGNYNYNYHHAIFATILKIPLYSLQL